MCCQVGSKDGKVLHANSEHRSDWTDGQADPLLLPYKRSDLCLKVQMHYNRNIVKIHIAF